MLLFLLLIMAGTQALIPAPVGVSRLIFGLHTRSGGEFTGMVRRDLIGLVEPTHFCTP